jgi:hypothetical protein
MTTCRYCSILTEQAFREAYEQRKPFLVERVTYVRRWTNVGGDTWEAEFFCTACRHPIVIRIELVDESDPADWWKK